MREPKLYSMQYIKALFPIGQPPPELSGDEPYSLKVVVVLEKTTAEKIVNWKEYPPMIVARCLNEVVSIFQKCLREQHPELVRESGADGAIAFG